MRCSYCDDSSFGSFHDPLWRIHVLKHCWYPEPSILDYVRFTTQQKVKQLINDGATDDASFASFCHLAQIGNDTPRLPPCVACKRGDAIGGGKCGHCCKCALLMAKPAGTRICLVCECAFIPTFS